MRIIRKYFYVILWVIVLSVLYSTLSIVRHNHFQSGAYDLGIYDQGIWQYSRFLNPYNTVKDRFILGDHLTLTLPLFAPLFWVWDNVRILFIAQAVLIASSCIPIFFLVKKRLQSYWMAFGVMVMYSLFYGIQYGIYFDFHPILLGATLLTWSAYAIECKKWKLFWVTWFLGILTQENMGIAYACLGFLYVFRKEYFKIALFLIFSGLGLSFIASKIIANLSPVGFQYTPDIPYDISTVISRLFDNEEKRQVWLYSYSWFSFLPLLSPGSVIAVVVDTAQYFIGGSNFSNMWSIFKHHRVMLAPFLTLGFVDVLSYLKQRKFPVHYLVIICLCVALFQQYYFHLPLNKLTKPEYWKEEQWMRDMRGLISQVPQEKSLASQQNLVPHVSHRKEIYLVWPRIHDIESAPCGQISCWWLDWGGKPEYLLVDTRPNQWLTQTLESNENWLSAVKNMEADGKITLERSVGDAKLYRIMYR